MISDCYNSAFGIAITVRLVFRPVLGYSLVISNLNAQLNKFSFLNYFRWIESHRIVVPGLAYPVFPSSSQTLNDTWSFKLLLVLPDFFNAALQSRLVGLWEIFVFHFGFLHWIKLRRDGAKSEGTPTNCLLTAILAQK